MVDLSKVKSIYLYGDNVSFRMGIDGLTNLILTRFKENEVEGNIYVFFNKEHKSVKIIEFESTGTWLYQKKLRNGRFKLPNFETEKTQFDHNQLKIILENIEVIARRKRYHSS